MDARTNLEARAAAGWRPLRIALFSGNYNYTRDGANLALNRLVAHLLAHGFEVRIYSPTRRSAAFPSVGTVVPAPSAPIPLRPDYRLAIGLTRALRGDLAAFAPDLLHLSTPDPLGWQARRMGRRLGVPVVASVHTRFDTYLGYYGLGWLTSLVQAGLDAFYRGCDYVLVPNPLLAEEFSRRALGPKIRVWGRGVDRALFSPAHRDPQWRRNLGFRDDDVVVLFLGRLVKEKGLEMFAHAVTQAAAGDGRIRALVVGDGPARSWFAEQLPGAVFTGALAGERLGQAVASSDIFLNPSLTETFGNVTLEAMAAGLPAVCADAPAHRALVGQGGGVLVAPHAAGAFAAALGALARDPEKRRALGVEARQQSARYNWPDVLDGVVDVYREACGAAAARPTP